jgi:hypothetical protein
MNRDVGPWLWFLGGMALVAVGAWLLWEGLAQRSWPSADAESHGARVVDRHEQRRRASTTYHDINVTLQFTFDGRPVTTTVTAESYLDRGPAEFWASKRYVPGTTHRVWFNPADPRDARVQAPHVMSAMLPGAPMIAIGALVAGFVAFGGRRRIAP